MNWKKNIALVLCSALLTGIMDSSVELSLNASTSASVERDSTLDKITTETNESTTVSTSDSKEDETSVKTETSPAIDIEETDDSGLISDNDNNLNTKASPGIGAFESGSLTYKFSDGVNSGGKYSSSTQIQISWQGWWAITNSTGKWSAIYFTSRKPSAPASEYDQDHGLQNFILSKDYNVKKLPVSGDIPHNSGGKTSDYFNLSSIPSNAQYLVLRGSGSDVHCYISYDGPTSADIDSTAPTVTYSAPAGFKNPSTNAEWYADSVDVTIKATDNKVNVTEIRERASYESETFIAHSTNSNPATYTKKLTSTAYIRAYAKDAVGNKSAANGTGTYNIDTAAPTITNTNGDNGTLTATIADSQSGLGSYVVSTSSTAPASGWTACDGSPSQNISFSATAGGTYYVHVKDITGHIGRSDAVVVSPLQHTQTIHHYKLLANNTWQLIATETPSVNQGSTYEVKYSKCPAGYKG